MKRILQLFAKKTDITHEFDIKIQDENNNW